MTFGERWISPCNSILQGCGSSNSWARALLYRLLHDINHHSQGTFLQALHWSVEATCVLDRGLTSLGLTLSQNKSVVVASHPQLLRAVRRELLEQGLSFEGAPSVRDVGLDANAGHRRSVKIQNKREQKCRKRNAHIKVIQNGLKSKHQTMKLFKTGILPAVAYGHAGMGMCPSSIQRKRTMAADSCGKRIKTARTTTILHFHFGENGDPGTWFPLDQLRTWLELQGEELGHRLGKIDVARAWAAAAASMRKKSRWSMVRGTMTATMCNFARPQHHLCLRGNGIPPKTQTSTGPTLVVTPVLSSVKCNRDSPTRFGNRRLCIITVSVRKMDWT